MFDVKASPFLSASQHGPRPLPLFLDMLREQTAASPADRAAALAGLAAYQAAPREAVRRPRRAFRRRGRARLIDYGGTGRPVVVVPSLINPPTILDLSPDHSLMRWLARAGYRALMLDWGAPTAAERAMSVGGHVRDLLVPMLRRLDTPPVLVGYCLGGTMAMAAAQLAPVAALALVAAPWRFAGYGEDARAEMEALWSAAAPGCERLGLVPMEVLQTGFWRLDPARTIAKYIAFAGMAPNSDAARAFVRLEDWANAGAPLSFGAGREIFDDFVAADVTGRGRWIVGGRAVTPDALPCPAAEFVSLTDRIVPAATAAGLAPRVETAAGHVGMMVGGRAPSYLWQPLSDWIATLPPPR
jgi:polyhydroxyalkanoate synthase